MVISAFLVLLIGGTFALRYATKGPSEDQLETHMKQQSFCPADIEKCSDGSLVHRSAPSCNFQKCPATVPQKNAPLFEDGTLPQDASSSMSASSSTH